MIKIAHIVICPFCNLKFDTDKEPYEKPSQRRYAHKKCYELAMASKSKEEQDKENLEEYIKTLFNIPSLTPKIRQQIKEYITKENFTYSGILATLKYSFEIKHNDISKANGGIGIVPYLYQEAKQYYQKLYFANKRNEQKIADSSNEKKVIEVIIPIPKRKPARKRKFKFLDEEE